MKNVTNNITNERIKELREEEGKTQDELAKDLHISREALANFETRRGITEDRLQDIADHFNTTVDYLLGKTNVRCNDNEDYQLIGKYTGLNDNAIKVLKNLKTISPNVIDTLNYLIEQEEIFYADLPSIEDADEAIEIYDKAEEYWNSIHYTVLSKITDYYNIKMPKETLYITDDEIKTEKDFKNRYEMMKETKTKISAENFVDKGLLDEIEYQLRKSKEYKKNKLLQRQQNKQMKEYIEKYNNVEKGADKK